MATNISQLNRCTRSINTYANVRLADKLSEWKEHCDDTKKYKGRTQRLGASQR